MNPRKTECLLLGFSVLVVILFLAATIPMKAKAAPDVVETFDSDQFIVLKNVFADGSTVYVSAQDGFSFGGSTLANVTDEMFGDMIYVWLFDDGNGPGDVPGDGTYTGSFTVVNDGGNSGQYTDDLLDILDLTDGGGASVVVDIDMMMDSGFTMVTADFTDPIANITSPSETVDESYTLTAKVTDPNVDTNNVAYTVDGGQSLRMTWLGADDFRAFVDTTTLSEGDHTIRVVAFDLAGNVNNSQIVVIDVHHPAPDISLVLNVSPSEPREGDRITFEVFIENTGDADAEDVTITLYVEWVSVDEATETIPAGEDRTVQLYWDAQEGSHDVWVEVTDGGARLASTPLELFEIGPAGKDPLTDPLVQGVIILVITIILIGGTVAGAYFAKELIRGAKTPNIPAEEGPAVPPGEEDPCEEIRRKWKGILAEYEREKLEMERSRLKAERLRERADGEWKEAEEARKKVDEANKAVLSAENEVSGVKEELVDYFARNLLMDGISVQDRMTGLDNNMAYFRGVVTVYFESTAYGEIVDRFVNENKDEYDELQENFDEAEKGLRKIQAEAAGASQRLAQAEMEARKAENLARQAEQEFEILKREVESLKEEAEAFRHKWRMCNLKRLTEATERAESAAQRASEAERGAQGATSFEELEKCKKEAEEAKGRAGEAKEDAQAIKKRLKEEDMDDELDQYDDRMERALSDIGSALERILGFSLMHRPDPGSLGKPCRGGETKVLTEYMMQYQLFDPTRRISMPTIYATQSGGDTGKALSEYLSMVANICERTKDVIEELPEGNLTGIPLDYWPTIEDAGTATLNKGRQKAGGLGYVKMSGLTIPTVQVTVMCREIMVCEKGTWQKVTQKVSLTTPIQGQLGYPSDDTLPFDKAIEWIQSRLESLRAQQKKLQEIPSS